MNDDVLLEAAGKLRRPYRGVDWAATPLGTMASWSPTLRNAVDLALHTQFPVTLFWGPEFVLVYNAAYASLIADKHPAALGTPAREVFPEAWDLIGPMMRTARAGQATWVEDAAVPLHRNGRLEEAYFTFSYSPVRDGRGAVEGVMDIATETTRQVIDRRRLAALGRLREVLAGVDAAEEVLGRALPMLRVDAADFPAVALVPARPGDGPLVVDGPVARLALGPEGSGRPALEVRLSAHLEPDPAYLGYLRLVASALALSLDRASARDAERGISAALQRSLLTKPLRTDDLEVAVRYRPAAREAQVGGDWYDAFTVPDGGLTIAVGDVTGHDRRAVAAMAQVRNLLRGVAYTARKPPARVLALLDEAMSELVVGVFATAVLAQVRDGALTWSNAGHPPPVLVTPEGRARLLETPPDVLLGLGDGPRADHVAGLEPGATVVLYTDGLVERRTAPLDVGLARLAGTLEGCHELGPEAICDRLLAQLGDSSADDVALLVLRT